MNLCFKKDHLNILNSLEDLITNEKPENNVLKLTSETHNKKIL